MSIEVDGRTFDWYPRKDPRSLAFTVADNFATAKSLRTRTRLQYQYLDQGSEGACTGFGSAKALGQTPDRRIVDNRLAQSIYHRARQLDEWPGEDYEGSSVLAAMQTVREAGFISAYYWATSLKQMQHAVCHLGSLVIGINWYEAMFDTDSGGFVNAHGDLVGGHAICVGGLDLGRSAFILHNSWGQSWGGRGGAPKGSAFLSFKDAERLVIGERGEAALMRKKRQR